MATISYKGYDIHAEPDYLVVTNEWSIKFIISAAIGGEDVDKIFDDPFKEPTYYKTKEEAIEQCFAVGKKVIDGEIPGLTVDDF